MFSRERTINVKRDTALSFEPLYLAVHLVVSPFERPNFIEFLVRSQCYMANSLQEADLVLFGGGPDVDPVLYGAKSVHPQTKIDAERDASDVVAYLEAVLLGIPMFGVCRGAQFLHVMNGGELYQHVDNHYGDHSLYDIVAKRSVNNVSSVHHQMVRENPDMVVVAKTWGKAKEKWLDAETCVESSSPNTGDVEAFFYRDTCCLGVQGHPEYRGYHEFAAWTTKMLYRYVVENPDIEFAEIGEKKKAYRLKKECIEARQNKQPVSLLVTE